MNKFKFIFFSILGFIFFLMPFELMGEKKIAISHIVSFITGNFLEGFISFTVICAWVVLLGTIIFAFHTSKYDYLNRVFKPSIGNKIMRVAGSLMYIVVINNWFSGNPFIDKILDPNTGGVMAGEGGLLTTLYITFFVGLMALPLLTHFGAVEFIGILFGRVVEKLFKVPGYSAVDAIASFVGDGTIGIVVTDTQYQRGYYNKREAYIIATSFSIVGIAFASAVAEELGFSHIFPVFYGAIVLVTVVLAFVTSRLPLKKFPSTYYQGVKPNKIEIPEGKTVFSHAYESAANEAGKSKLFSVILNSFKSVIDIYVGFLPIIMFVGTSSLIVAEHTSFFTTISAPLVGLYEMIGYSNDVAGMMAPASVVGFADMYLPSLFITESVSEASRFFIGVLAFTQLVFMSETGMVLVKSKIGVSIIDVVKIFAYRTVLSLPILFLVTEGLVYFGMLSY